MSSIDFTRARAFIDAIPEGRWAAYKDVATAGVTSAEPKPSARGSAARVTAFASTTVCSPSTARMPDTFRSAGWDAPADPASAVSRLRSEGVAIDDRARAANLQRFSASDWRPERLSA